MGVRAVFDAVRTLVRAEDPTVEFILTAEAIQFQGTPPKIVWELPAPGMEEFNRSGLGPGYSGTTTLGRLLWARNVTCNIHVWMPAASAVDADGVEYPDDNEDVTAGQTWLVQRLIRALHTTLAGQYEILRGGWGDRTMANLGFLYVLSVRFKLGVFDSSLPYDVAVIQTTEQTVTME